MKYFLVYLYYLLRLHKIFNKTVTVSDINLNFYTNLENQFSEKYRLNLFSKTNFNFKKINTVLDFGSGLGIDIGILTSLNKDIELFLYDINRTSLLYAKRANEILFKKKIYCLDETEMNLMLTKKNFDLIFTNATLIYLSPKKLIDTLKKFIASKPKFILMHELSKPWNLKENLMHNYYLHDLEKILKSLRIKYEVYKSSKPGHPFSVYGKIIAIYL
jgi:ubiquinone/menaquinone biosynthesis C-methylase UbiE